MPDIPNTVHEDAFPSGKGSTWDGPFLRGREHPNISEQDVKDDPYGQPFRDCSYCGSIHPADFLEYIKQGARFSWADFKYGWPHKLYIDGIKNPKYGQMVVVSRTYGRDEDGKDIDSKTYSPAPEFTHAKFYTQHLRDVAKADPELFKALAEAIKPTGVTFEADEKGVKYHVCPDPSKCTAK